MSPTNRSPANPRSLPAPTPWWTVLRQQLRLLAAARRRGMLIFTALALVMSAATAFSIQVVGLHGETLEDGRGAFELKQLTEAALGMPEVPGLLAVLFGFSVLLYSTIFWAVAVWSGEGPSRRDYHGSLPVPRPAHDLARLAAGVVWLLAGTAMMLLALAVGLLASGRASALAVPTWQGWLDFFLGPLILYLLVSLASLTNERPGRTVLLAFLVLYGSLPVLAWIGAEPDRLFVHAFITGELSFGKAVAGAVIYDLGIPDDKALGSGWPALAACWLAAAVALVLLAVRRPRLR